MKRFLVVGCGGTGAATLAYLRDHLRDTMARQGWAGSRLPVGWQFVVFDVPPTATSDSKPSGRPPAIGLGEGTAGEGAYVSTGYPSGDYPMLDTALSNRLGLVH
ncbi:MAG: tubulin-like doman-containing protein, partial [Propionibacteriaceae bacterium]|nr:tubulin-like doman-containing protein [Propionibacteriaceae bacterium]